MKNTIHVDAKVFFAAAQFMAIKDVRYFLNGVYIEPHPKKGVYVVGLDGHRIGVGYDPEGYAESPRICEVPTDLKKALKRKNAQTLVFQGSACAVYSDSEPVPQKIKPSLISPIFLSTPIDGEYPNWQKVVAAYPPSQKGCITLQNKYLSALKELQPILNPSSRRYTGAVTFSPCANGGAMCRFKNLPNFFAIVMSMSGERSVLKLPEWLVLPEDVAA